MLLNKVFDLPFTQSEVDFVIPDLAVDLPLAIDPFLLFKSRDPELRALHDQLLSIFNEGIRLYREGNRTRLYELIIFPEVNEIGFGYSEGKIAGGGLDELNTLLADTLTASPSLQERGLRHIEELQLLTIGVGPDRVSDIAANALKHFLVEYTQQRAAIWNIPITPELPINHYFDFETWNWIDGTFDLPLNPVSNLPILLVPRRIVRLLPWINFNDYARSDFKFFLQPKPKQRPDLSKTNVIEITRDHLNVLDKYINRKEQDAENAYPALGPGAIVPAIEFEQGNSFIERLQAVPPGHAASGDYQRLVYEVLNYLFEPDLTDGKMEVKTYEGTERRDILYINECDRRFLKYVREAYKTLFILFEIKNVTAVEIDHVNQVAAYLGNRLGMLGFIVTRNAPGDNIILKTYSVFNDTPDTPKKMVLVATDEDLIHMIHLKQRGEEPMTRLRDIYVRFRQKVQ